MAKSKLSSRFTLARDEVKYRTVASLDGEVGCIAEDVPLMVRRQERHTRMKTMGELYAKFNGFPQAGHQWDSSPTYIQSLADDETLFYNRVVAVTDSGVKELTSIVFDDGSSLKATPDHPVLTLDGFVEAGNLLSRHKIVGRGSCGLLSEHAREGYTRPDRVMVNLKYHPYGSVKRIDSSNHPRSATHKIYEYTRVHRARLVLEAVVNNLSYDEFVHILNTDAKRAWSLRFMPPYFEVHHRDEDPMNDAYENLAVLTKEEHARLHGRERKAEKYDWRRIKRAKSVKSAGMGRTFDIQMAAPAHNFCAGETVVHNTGKTYFVCTAPAPILIQNIDKGTEGVVEQFRKKGKEIYEEGYDWNPGEIDESDLQAAAVEIRDRWEKDYYYAIENGIRTVGMDTESRIWQAFRYAEFGDPNADSPRDYDKLNLRFEAMVNKAKECDINLFMLRSMKDHWGLVGKVNAKTGKKGFGKAGREVWGYEHLPGMMFMELTFEHLAEDDPRYDEVGEYGIKIGKCRHNVNMQFTTIPRCKFTDLGMQLIEDSEKGDWE